jgi:epoxyqueuosine reductase
LSEVKEQIRQRALELGFDDCRCTTANPPDHAAAFNHWIAEKHYGEMAWIERNAHKRVNPQEVLPGAKSILCLAVSYASNTDDNTSLLTRPSGTLSSIGEEALWPIGSTNKHVSTSLPPEGSISAGVIARYARYPDYHDILAEQLKLLTQSINKLGGADTRSLWYVDTGPLLERDHAQRAGLGFVGKHTNLISRKLGNWIFLAEIITTLELEPDAPERNRCGTCSRCIVACPTNAITAPFKLDARKCISYLTIELKGFIPEELRPAIGNRIYGCDDCLAACPWNRFAQEGRIMKDHFRSELNTPDLIELLGLDQPQFKARFAGSPVLRTKRRGLLRNVCVALGNVGDEAALPALEKAALDSEPLIAEHARWAMEQIRSRKRA